MDLDTGISPELKDELRFIEKESRFMSQTPPSMRGFTIFLWCAFAAVLVAQFLAMKSGNLFSVVLLPVVAVFILMAYFRVKKLHGMYSDAGEIIGYYQQKMPKKVDPHFESQGSSEGLLP